MSDKAHEEVNEEMDTGDNQKPEDAEEDPDILEMKQKLLQMQAEAEKLQEMQNKVEREIASSEPSDSDARSIYVGNVDYQSTPEELQAHFESCGTINRITILCDKFTGHPKGYAYIEFLDAASVQQAVDDLNESLFKGRQLKVTSKRTNLPGYTRGRGRARGGYRAYRPRGRFGRRFNPYFRGAFRGGFS
eukprot:c33468_g1_i1.p1 GENE.c33468_g1_i1~~c33468_g1_i1.p1  ORF type:complete len:198 (-),score=24.72 c33468_g1_i1:123-692(-)